MTFRCAAVAGFCFCVVGASASLAQEPAQGKRWTATVDADVRYYSWERTAGNPAGEPKQSGWQVYSPIGIQVIGTPVDTLKVELLLRGGYVKTSRSVNPNLISILTGTGTGFATGTVSTPTDTVIGTTFTYLGFDGFQPFYSANINFPTGQSVLFGLASFARSDPDMVDVASFGQGLNVANTVGVNIPFTPDIMLTLSGGYTGNGAYNREAQTTSNLLGITNTLDTLKPSDTASVSANLAMGLGNWTVNLSGMTSWDTPSRLNGVETFRNGQVYFTSAMAGYKWNEMWSSSLTGSFSHTERIMVADPVTGVLLAEPLNSNSNLLRVAFNQTATWQAYTFNFIVNYMRRYQNEYSMTAAAFVPARTKWGVGGSAKYVISDNFSLNGRIERFWINDDAKPDTTVLGSPMGPPQRFEGWIFTFGGTATL